MLRGTTWNHNFTSAFDDRTSFCARWFAGHLKSQFDLSIWRSNLISFEKVARDNLRAQFYFSFWRSSLISCERVRGTTWNRNFTSVFDDRASFRAKGFAGHLNSHFYLSFWRSNLISCEKVARGKLKSHFYLSFWRSNLISCERVARGNLKSQFYLSIWRSNLILCERVRGTPEIAILPQFLAIEPHFVRKGCAGQVEIAILVYSVFDDRTSFRAKGLRGTSWNRTFTSVFDDRTSFSATGQVEIAILPQFLAIKPHFVRKGCAGQVEIAILLYSFWRSNLVSCERVARDKLKSQFYFSFWRSNLVSCERVAFRAVSLALPLPPPSEEK